MKMLNHGARLGLLAALALPSVACKSKLTGNKGNFTFSYHATEDVTDFNKPIAVGAKLDLKVEEPGVLARDIDVKDATTDDPGVLEVVSFSGNTVVLLGTGAGQALVQVTGKNSQGETLDDEVNMQARVPEVVKIDHSCTTADEGRYLAGQEEVWLHFDLEMDNGQAVIGYGYHPVSFEPADAVTVNQTSNAQEFIGMKVSDTPQSVSVKADIGDEALTMTLVDPASIDGAQLDEAGTRTPILVDRTRWLLIRPTIGGEPICQAKTPVEAVTSTPDLCEIASGDDPEHDLTALSVVEKWGFISVKGVAPGACKFTVKHPASGDDPVETEFSVTIGEIDTGDAELDE